MANVGYESMSRISKVILTFGSYFVMSVIAFPGKKKLCRKTLSFGTISKM